MMKKTFVTNFLAALLCTVSMAQAPVSPVVSDHKVPNDIQLQITKAEDARAPGPVIAMLSNMNPAVRYRAALAAGRIGDEAAIERLGAMLSDSSIEVRTMAAFSLGETESLKAAAAVIKGLKAADTPSPVRGRLAEAAGKIAAANAGPANAPAETRDTRIADLGNAILDMLEAEEGKREKQHIETVRLGLTAALRARTEGSDTVVALFLTNLNPQVRADAANTMARLRAKNANPALRGMLMNDEDPTARANAARALGAAEDKETVNMLIDAATEDDDLRVRVSAIRSLAALRDPFAVERMLAHGEKLLAEFKKPQRGGAVPAEKNELLEVASALGRLIPRTNDARTVRFLNSVREADRYRSPETEIALARVAPASYVNGIEAIVEREGYTRAAPRTRKPSSNWQVIAAAAQGLGAIAALDLSNDPAVKPKAVDALHAILRASADPRYDPRSFAYALPDVFRAYAPFKTPNLDQALRASLLHSDPMVRTAAAELLGGLPRTEENFNALKSAYTRSLLTDKRENDAQLAILDALYKLDKRNSVGIFLMSLSAPDYLVRRKTLEILADQELQKGFPGVPISLAEAREKDQDQVRPYSVVSQTRLGQVLNTDADYRRALARRNGSVKAVLTTTKGSFTIDLLPEDAPLTVDNFVKLARANYFNGLEVHRVVPNFVMQDGDPRGDGNGGPGWSIRCEINMVPFDRGYVGMALSGKDTGGSQWFVTHSPQPHLDGGYTVFGKVNETGMKVVDNIVRGDKIVSVRIIEGTSSPRPRKK